MRDRLLSAIATVLAVALGLRLAAWLLAPVLPGLFSVGLALLALSWLIPRGPHRD
jgi:hypothetical protein